MYTRFICHCDFWSLLVTFMITSVIWPRILCDIHLDRYVSVSVSVVVVALGGDLKWGHEVWGHTWVLVVLMVLLTPHLTIFTRFFFLFNHRPLWNPLNLNDTPNRISRGESLFKSLFFYALVFHLESEWSFNSELDASRAKYQIAVCLITHWFFHTFFFCIFCSWPIRTPVTTMSWAASPDITWRRSSVCQSKTATTRLWAWLRPSTKMAKKKTCLPRMMKR